MEPDDFLCSQNAHDKNVLAREKSASRRALGWVGENVARSKGQPWPLPKGKFRESEAPLALMARPGNR